MQRQKAQEVTLSYGREDPWGIMHYSNPAAPAMNLSIQGVCK